MVSDQVRHKPGCTATEDGKKLEISDLDSSGIVLYICSENKGADQLRGYREADLRLCFRICKKPVFSRHHFTSKKIWSSPVFIPLLHLMPGNYDGLTSYLYP